MTTPITFERDGRTYALAVFEVEKIIYTQKATTEDLRAAGYVHITAIVESADRRAEQQRERAKKAERERDVLGRIIEKIGGALVERSGAHLEQETNDAGMAATEQPDTELADGVAGVAPAQPPVALPESTAAETEPGRLLRDELERRGLAIISRNDPWPSSHDVAAVESACIERGRKEAQADDDLIDLLHNILGTVSGETLSRKARRLVTELAAKDREIAALREELAVANAVITRVDRERIESEREIAHARVIESLREGAALPSSPVALEGNALQGYTPAVRLTGPEVTREWADNTDRRLDRLERKAK